MINIRKTIKWLGIKKSLTIVFVMCLFFSQVLLVSAWQSDNGDGTFTNPPLFSDYPDPSMIRVGNYFYLATSSFVNVPGLVICRSEDMVNWEIAGHCITTLTGNNAYNMIGGVKYGGGCFAPSIGYKNGTFYVVATPNGEATRIYSAKDVAGPWNVSTLSGSYFDPALFIEDDGTAYLAYGGAWQNEISMIQLNSTLSATVGSSKVILSYKNVEGSHLSKVDGKYYLFNAVPAQRLVCSRSNTLWGPYGETTTLCTAGKGGHQGGIVDLPDGSYWGYLHQDDGAIGRPTRICPITWQNGWPMFGRAGNIGQVESKYTKPIANKSIKVPQASDEFNGSTLGLQWMWNHNPDNTKWSFTGSALRLKASTGSDFWHARNSLTQKGQGLTSSASIKVDCSQMQSGDICGLGILGDPRGYIAVTKDPKRIIMSEEDTVKATVSNITSDILYFRVEMNFSNKQAKFFWKDDEAKSWQPLGTTITMGFDWQYGTFQGEQYAILNFNTGSSTGYCDIDWFRLNDAKGPDGNETPGPTSTPLPTPGPRSAFSQIEAEDFSDQSGVEAETCSDGGQDIGYIENDDYILYKDIDFGSGAQSFEASVASNGSGGNIELRLDSITGPLVGTCPVAVTGDWQAWVTAKCDVSGASGVHDLYLKFTGDSGYLFNINWWKFVVDDTKPTVKSADINNDGFVNMADVIIIALAFNSVVGDAKFNEACDLNNDGAINMNDVMIIASKFNTVVTASSTPTNTPKVTQKPTPTPTKASVSPSSNKPSYRKVGNPYLPGWEYIPDGEPRVFGDRVYVYGSHDNANSTKFCDTKLRVWSAPIDDLENWRDEGDAFHSKADEEGIDDLSYTNNDLYAPDVVEKDGKYYLYYYVVGAAGGVAVSDSPAGPFKYLSRYGNGNGAQYPDPGVLVDDDGSVYMYYGFQGSYMCQMDPKDMFTILPNTTINNLLSTTSPFFFFEAASMRKIGNTYYLIYSPNNATTTLVYATSSSPKGPFKYGGTIINSGRNYPGANDHGSICNINGQWYIFYHRMTNNTMYSRKGCVEKIKILPDGSIPEVEMTSMGFSESLSPYQSNPADLSCYLTGGNYSTEVDVNTRPVINNKNNSVIGFKYFDFTRTNTSEKTTFSAKIRYGKTAGKMEIRLDNPNSGTLIGTLDIGSKSGDTNWYTLSTNVSNVTGSHALYFRFTGASSGDSICDVASFEFK